MADSEHPQTEAPSSEGLARDVAQLYSFAHAEGVPYRVFSRGARQRSTGHPLAEEHAPAETVQATVHAEQASQTESVAPPAPPAQAGVEHASGISVPPLRSELPAGSKTAIAVVSIAGGVGKTTISANAGRILSERGEHVLLVDATGSGLLPFYFGAEDMRSGMRTFLAPEPEMPPIRILGAERVTHEWLEAEVKPAMQTAQRTIFDLGPASYGLLPEILPLCAMILVPLVVDLNSIMSIPRVEAHNKRMRTEFGLVDLPKPLYLLNKLDATNEREQQGRDLIEREVGIRLLPFSIHRSPAVADAIGGRMTVSDYAPESDVSKDFIQLALWIKKAVPITQLATHIGRWSEA